MNTHRLPFSILLLVALSSCADVVLTDIAESSEYNAVIGEQYEVIGAVDAYGIRDHSAADVEYITLIPPPGFEGSEVGFSVPVERGSTITVNRVMRTSRWFDSRIAFIVSIEGTTMPVAAPARIELGFGNQGSADLQLNPKLYRKLPDTRSRQ